ncbi:MAG TPA: phospholipase D-like domain-containing protein [Actinomycetaceae bacterium]|nr:phospholipase D-like domain-containing protein [Actinomycetaceae bacterium]
MAPSLFPTRSQTTWALRRAVGVAIAVPLSAAAGVMAVDRVRLRRSPPTGRFPRLESGDVRIPGDNLLTVFTEGSGLYESMLEDIRSAKSSIFLETFIWKGDALGELFKKELTRAAHRGVDVYVVYDAFANLVVPPSFKKLDPALHVQAHPIITGGNPFAIQTYAKNHRKLLVVDERIGYVGGYNIGQLYADTWRDTHLRVEGPSVWELANAFTDYWNNRRKRDQPELPDRGAGEWEPRIRAIQNLPDRMLFPVRGVYIDAIDRSTVSVRISQAYFLPDSTLIDAMVRAAARGVKVELLIPEYSNHIVVDWAARHMYQTLLEAGVRIHRFRHAMIHAKTMTVDGRWTTLGTTNVDRLSFTGNFEINLAIYDEALARHMDDVFAVDLTNSRELTLDEWEARPRYKMVVERAMAPLAPLL